MERTNRIPLTSAAQNLVFHEAPRIARENGHQVVTYPHIAAVFYERPSFAQALLNSGLNQQEAIDWGHGLKINPPKPNIPVTVGSAVFDRSLRMLFDDAEGLAREEKAPQVDEIHLFRVLFNPKKEGAFHDIFLFKDPERLQRAIFEELDLQSQDERAA